MGPRKDWGFSFIHGFFSPAVLKKQNPAQTLWQHRRNSKPFVVKQPFNNVIFHMLVQVIFLAYWRNLRVWLQKEQGSPRGESCSWASRVHHLPAIPFPTASAFTCECRDMQYMITVLKHVLCLALSLFTFRWPPAFCSWIIFRWNIHLRLSGFHFTRVATYAQAI